MSNIEYQTNSNNAYLNVEYRISNSIQRLIIFFYLEPQIYQTESDIQILILKYINLEYRISNPILHPIFE